MVGNNLSEIPSEVARSVLCEIVENQLKSKHYNLDVSSASNDGETNFIGVLYRVSFWEKSDEAVQDQNINRGNSMHKLILKITPRNMMRREKFMSRPAFLREIQLYESILPVFREFERSNGVSEDDSFCEYPKCYRTVDKDLDECLFLEDVCVRGFKLIDKNTDVVTAEHVRLVLQSVAKFHAISFVLKDQHPERFSQLTSNLEDMRRRDSPVRERFRRRMESIVGVLSEKSDTHLLAKVRKLFEKEPLDVAVDCIETSKAEPAAVITHGDLHQNNMMFRYDTKGIPVETSLLDWQISRLCSPVIDIVFFIFCCTTKVVRDEHYDEFLKFYHKTLSAHIQRLGSDSQKLFPYETMLEHFRKYGRYGLIMSSGTLRYLTPDNGLRMNLDEKINQDFDQPSIFTQNASERAQNEYKNRLRDVVIDMARLEYI